MCKVLELKESIGWATSIIRQSDFFFYLCFFFFFWPKRFRLTIHCPIIATGTPHASLLIVTLNAHFISLYSSPMAVPASELAPSLNSMFWWGNARSGV